jgi:hypothetical protein
MLSEVDGILKIGTSSPEDRVQSHIVDASGHKRIHLARQLPSRRLEVPARILNTRFWCADPFLPDLQESELFSPANATDLIARTRNETRRRRRLERRAVDDHCTRPHASRRAEGDFGIVVVFGLNPKTTQSSNGDNASPQPQKSADGLSTL